MVSGSAPIGFTIRPGYIRKASFTESTGIVIKAGNAVKMSKLALDVNISPLQKDSIKEFFGQAPDCFESLRRMSPSVPELSKKLSLIDTIAVSPKGRKGGKFIEGKNILALNLGTVMAEIKRADEEKADKIGQDAGTIAIGVDPASTSGGTIFSTGYASGPGNILFKEAIYKLMPFNVGDIYSEDKIGFYDRLIDEIGKGNVGRYELELAIVRQMFLKGMTEGEKESIFNGLMIALRGDRSVARPGYALKLAIKSADNGYLAAFEKSVIKNVKSALKSLIKRLAPSIKIAKDRGESEDLVALLILGAYLKTVSESVTEGYLNGKLQASQYADVKRGLRGWFNDVFEYLNGEEKDEKRIFTLQFVLDIIKTMVG